MTGTGEEVGASGSPLPTAPRPVSGRHVAIAAAVILFLCGTGALVGALVPSDASSGGHTRTATTDSVTAGSPTVFAASPGGSRLAQFLGLSTLGPHRAPSFSLTDESGTRRSLRTYRHEVVVLTFLDDRCSALCPVLPEELVDAWHDLGRAAPHVAFLGVNVDALRAHPRQLAAFSLQFGLDTIGDWTFLTGTPAQLEEVWREYDVSVVRGPGSSVAYSGAIYFISTTGEESYVATPYADETANGTGTLTPEDINRWGSGIAQVAASLLTGESGSTAAGARAKLR